MPTPPHIVLHAGLHKTGTTSIQAFLHRNRAELRDLGVDFYAGLFKPANHVELHAAAMRCERESGFKRRSGLRVDEAFRSNVKARVREYICQSRCRRIVFSNEGLSLLRYPDEMDQLRQTVPFERIEIVLYLRNVQDFARSYSLQLRKHPAVFPSVVDKDSFAYLEPDSWLFDFESRLKVFRDAFGVENVTVVDYDREVELHGNVIPSFLRIIGVESTFRQGEWRTLFLNRSPGSSSPGSR